MAYPIWDTSSDLGSVASGATSLSYTMTANDSTSIAVISNATNGTIALTATTATLTLDAPYVTTDTTYSVILRASNSQGVTDRTFTLTVLSVGAITWTQTTTLPKWVMGSRREIALTAEWTAPIEYVLVSGQLPPGVFLDSTGVIYGIAGTNLIANSLDSDTWIIDGVATQSGISNYDFVVRARSVSDKTIYTDRTFQMQTIPRPGLDASSDIITADSTITADSSNNLSIVLLTANDLGSYKHSNQFIKQIKVWNPTGGPVDFELLGNSNGYDTSGYDQGPTVLNPSYIALSYDGYQATTAPYLQVEQHSGFVTGVLPFINFQEQTNSFSVSVSKVSTGENIVPEFTLKLLGEDGIDFEFIDPAGNVIDPTTTYSYSIRQGEVSNLRVQARLIQDPQVPLYYELVLGQMPGGLALTASGLISGKTGWLVPPDTYSFSVMVYNPAQNIDELSPRLTQTQTFRITVTENVSGTETITGAYDAYYRAYLPQSQRTVWRNLITDQRIFNNSILYRAEDSRFGRRYECEFLAFPGLSEYQAAQFVGAMKKNWANKRFYIGNLHFATVKDTSGNYLCDAIYVDIKDPQLNDSGNGPPLSIRYRGNNTLNEITSDTTNINADDVDITADATEDYLIYPASLENQLDRLKESVGQATDSLLPIWMKSAQADGRPLGWIPAAVLCYVLPGQGAQVLRKIKTSTHKLNQIDFHVDRVVLRDVPVGGPTLFDGGFTIFNFEETSFDTELLEDKYIYFNTDGEIYDIKH